METLPKKQTAYMGKTNQTFHMKKNRRKSLKLRNRRVDSEAEGGTIRTTGFDFVNNGSLINK